MSEILFQPLGDPIGAGESLQHIADIDPRMTRTHYFDGRLLTAEDLERDQIYLDQRLREIGKTFGHGVISGMELSFDPYSGLLTLESGLAMTSLGRVLQLNSQLQVSLGDRALISQLNNSKYRKFNRALYGVVLRYVEVATDIAEVFPTDLASKRGSDYGLVTEALQMGLVQLPLSLPEQDSLHIRANLMRELLGGDMANSLVPEDSVSLGIIAIQNDTPQWLDSQLLRQPLRPEKTTNPLQQDLSRQYEALLADIFTSRSSRSLTNQFAASDYFSLLPPTGTLPKESIDAVNGHQGFFPEHFNVHIAPIRLSDLELIQAESMELANIDLTGKEPVDIVALAPLTNQDYGRYGSRLEREYDPVSRRLPQLDLLRLKLYPTHPVHTLDTDAATWQLIWDIIADNQLLFVRRPVRAAETAVSGIVLARGSSMPTVEEPVVTDDSVIIEETVETDETDSIVITPPPDFESVIEDEDTVFLRFINFQQLSKSRPPQDSRGKEAVAFLIDKHGKDAKVVRQTNDFFLQLERYYDPVAWPSLRILVEKETLAEMVAFLQEPEPRHPIATGERVIERGDQFGFGPDLTTQWKELVEKLHQS